MAFNNLGNQWYQPTAGLNNVGSYQTSAIPWASSSLVAPASSGTPLQIDFPYVTKFIVVKNLTSNNLRVGFSENGIKGSNYFVLTNLESFQGDFRVTKLFLLADGATPTTASVVAGLTGIGSGELQNSWSGSVGVG